MYSKSLIVLSSGAALVAGITPSGFTPVSNTDLAVVYGQVAATNGVLVDKASKSSVDNVPISDSAWLTQRSNGKGANDCDNSSADGHLVRGHHDRS